MAAPNIQWKRPWVEKEENGGPPQVTGLGLNLIAAPSVPVSPHELPNSRSQGPGFEGRELINSRQYGGSSSFVPSPQWYQNPGYVRDDRSKNYYSVPPIPEPNKRPCLEARASRDASSAALSVSSDVPGRLELGYQIRGSANVPTSEFVNGSRFEAHTDSRSLLHNTSVPGHFTGQLQNPNDLVKPILAGHDIVHTESKTSKQCSTCQKAGDVAPRVAKGLERLHGQLRMVLAQDKVNQPVGGEFDNDLNLRPAPDKLLEALEWSMEKLNESMRVAKDMLSGRVARTTDPGQYSSQDESAYGQAAAGDRFKPKREQDDRFGQRGSLRSPSTSDDGFRSHELPSIFGKERRNSLALQAQSPTQVPAPNRGLPSLPSPASLNFSSHSNVLLPISPSVAGTGPRSPRTAHLQELQHQVSHKSLAYQILQGEHEKLMAAFTRSQTRCAALDKKSQVSDTEINNLSEDRIRLQSEIEALEQQVEDLQQSRDNAQKQSVSSGSQYMQIVALSSKLQAQSTADERKWKADRESWIEEKGKLSARIAALEGLSISGETQRPESQPDFVAVSDVASVQATESSRDNGMSSPGANDLLASMSLEQLKSEVARLRKEKHDADSLIRAYREERDKMHRVLAELGGIGERMKRIDLGATGIQA